MAATNGTPWTVCALALTQQFPGFVPRKCSGCTQRFIYRDGIHTYGTGHPLKIALEENVNTVIWEYIHDKTQK